MTHIKWPNNPATPIPNEPKWPTELRSPVPCEPSWQEEAMRQSALLYQALTRAANAEAKLAKAVGVIKVILVTVDADNYIEWFFALDDAQELITEMEKTE